MFTSVKVSPGSGSASSVIREKLDLVRLLIWDELGRPLSNHTQNFKRAGVGVLLPQVIQLTIDFERGLLVPLKRPEPSCNGADGREADMNPVGAAMNLVAK